MLGAGQGHSRQQDARAAYRLTSASILPIKSLERRIKHRPCQLYVYGKPVAKLMLTLPQSGAVSRMSWREATGGFAHLKVVERLLRAAGEQPAPDALGVDVEQPGHPLR